MLCQTQNRPSDRRASIIADRSAICVRHISVSGALQFAVFHAVGCVFHRPTSRVIHCSELFLSFLTHLRRRSSSREKASITLSVQYCAHQRTDRQHHKRQIPVLGPAGHDRQLRPLSRSWRSRGDKKASTLYCHQNQRETLFFLSDLLFGSDPSAGSPTETLLRLLLPLDDTV